MALPEDRLLTVDEVAHFLRVTKYTIRKWDKKNILKSVRIGERKDRRYYLSAVMALLREEKEDASE